MLGVDGAAGAAGVGIGAAPARMAGGIEGAGADTGGNADRVTGATGAPDRDMGERCAVFGIWPAKDARTISPGELASMPVFAISDPNQLMRSSSFIS